MSDFRLIPLPTPQTDTPEPNTAVLERLEALLAQARAGEVVGLLWASVDREDTVAWGMAGALGASEIALAHRALGYSVDQALLGMSNVRDE